MKSQNKTLFITHSQIDVIQSRIRLCLYLTKQGFDITIYAPRYNYPNSKLSIKTYSSNIGFAVSIISWLIFPKYDIYIFRGILNLPVVLLSILLRRKTIWYITGLGRLFSNKDLYSKKVSRLIKYIITRMQGCRCFRLILQNNSDVKTLDIRDDYVVNGSGCAFKAFKGRKTLSNKRINILYVGRLMAEKGLDDLIRLAFIIKDIPKFNLTVIGEYDQRDHKIYGHLIQRLNGFNNIAFVGRKKVTCTDYEDQHFAFFPSKYGEGVPRFLIESSSQGLVVCTSDAPGCRQFVSKAGSISYLNPKSFLDEILRIEREGLFEQLSARHVSFFSRYLKDSIVFSQFNDHISKFDEVSNR